MLSENEFLDLIGKLNRYELSPAEQQLLLDAVNAGEHSALLKEQIFQGLSEGGTHPDWTTEMQETLLSEILRVTHAPKRKTIPMRVLSLAAAAVLLIAAAIAYMTWTYKPAHDEHSIAHVSKRDVAPGRQGAVLTLSDGKQIVLDSSGNGQLATQGRSEVMKSGGQIRYNYDPATAAAAPVFNTLVTARGREYSLVLPDGSTVWLNAASSITFPTSFTGQDRDVSITGEVYFEVAKDPSRPFHVHVRDMNVTVLGTHFNIKSYENEGSVQTTLIEGAVRVNVASVEKTLKPGDQAVLSRNSGTLEVASGVDTDFVMNWKNGYTSFKSADIRSIMRQVERWYDVDVKYEGAIPVRTFTGDVSRKAPVSEVFNILKESGIHYRIENKILIITP